LPSWIIFDELADRYDKWYEVHRITAENELRLLTSILGTDPGRCLEIGVGTGWFASRLGCRYGIDPAYKMLEHASRRGIDVVLGRGERLPFRSSAFDTVLLIVTLCFVDDPLVLLKEAKRVLRKEGRLITCIVPRDTAWGKHYTKKGQEGHVFYSKAKFYTVQETISLIRYTGLRPRLIHSTLTYGPADNPVLEEPRKYRGGEGFVCIMAGQ